MLIISKSNGEIIKVNPEIILFDKDGTLIDIHHYWSSMLKLRASLIIDQWFKHHINKKSIERDLIDSMGVDLLSGKIKLKGPVGIKSRNYIVGIASNIVRSNGIDIENQEIEDIFLEIDSVTSNNMMSLLRPLPGVLSLLKNLKNMGILMAVVSNDITSRTYLALKSLGINDCFTEVIGGDEVQNNKPSADLALLVSQKTGIKVDKMMVIGDSLVDIKMGLSAKINLNVAVLTGLSEKKSFEGFNCIIIDNLESIEVSNVK